jgi:hypothetical protein
LSHMLKIHPFVVVFTIVAHHVAISILGSGAATNVHSR